MRGLLHSKDVTVWHKTCLTFNRLSQKRTRGRRHYLSEKGETTLLPPGNAAFQTRWLTLLWVGLRDDTCEIFWGCTNFFSCLNFEVYMYFLTKQCKPNVALNSWYLVSKCNTLPGKLTTANRMGKAALSFPTSCAGGPNASSSAAPTKDLEPPGSPALLWRKAWILCLVWLEWDELCMLTTLQRGRQREELLCWKEMLYKACLSPF